MWNGMKEFTKEFFLEILRTILFLACLTGAPIWFITNRYNLYDSVQNAPVTNQANAALFVLVLLILPAIILVIRAIISSFPNTGWKGFIKNFIHGIMWAMPIFVFWLFFRWIVDNSEFILDMLFVWMWAVIPAFIVAPNYVKIYKEKKG